MAGVAGVSVGDSESVVKLTLEYDGGGVAGWAARSRR